MFLKDGQYSKFDDKGLPTHFKDGREVKGEARNKLIRN